MPRGGRKHQHNNRHENGLVRPGKQITKQKSNGHLNGAAKGTAPSESLSAISTPAPHVVASTSEPTAAVPSETQLEAIRRPSHHILTTRDSESSYDGQSQDNVKKWEATNGQHMAVHRRNDAVAAAKTRPSQEVSALQIASTILRSRPACDTIALLIVLLALPSMMLTVAQVLFAALTLMPGSGSTPMSLWSLFDVFQGSPGSPSITTMVSMDAFCFVVWLGLWNWAQNFALDLAQIHVAITLGNGSSSKSNSAGTFCSIMVLLLHTVRSRDVRKFVLANIIPTSLISQTRLADYAHLIPNDMDFGDTPGPPSKLRSAFAIHIVSQALVSFVRRRIANSQANGGSKSGKRVDTEASAGFGSQEGSAIEGNTSTAITSGTDYQQSMTPGVRESKDKGVSAKKRRRQANHVRSKQPFWAALASTKVHVLREVEHNKGLTNPASHQQASFDNADQDVVWITNVESSIIQFDTCFTHVVQDDDGIAMSDHSKPFHVRINGARWNVSLECLDTQPTTEASQARWSGEIAGLAPNCTYTCSFIRSDDEEEFATVMVKTPVLTDGDYSSTMPPPPLRQSTRPDSPTSTLRNSIASAEAKLAEARKRLGQVKRQHKASLNKVDREVDTLASRLKSGGDDNKLRQKLLQTERNMRQTEDTTTSLKSALETLDTVPEDEETEHDTRKSAYEEQKMRLTEANDTLLKARSVAEGDLSCIGGELSTVAGRKKRLQERQSRLNEQHDRITQANAQGLNEKERKQAESTVTEAAHLKHEESMRHSIATANRELQEIRMRTQSSWREIDAMERQDMVHRQKMYLSSGPLTPEGELPGTRTQAQLLRSSAFGGPPGNPDHQASPFLAYAKTLPSQTLRPRSDTNRSAGGLSNYSADFDDADPIPPMPTTIDYDTNGRKGSGSTGSRGQNNSSPGVIGGTLRSPQPGNHSPGHIPGATTW